MSAPALATFSTAGYQVTQKRGAVKVGFGINIEQAIADGGDTGGFARLGWNDGATESYAFTEADRSLSFGGQLSGARWAYCDHA